MYLNLLKQQWTIHEIDEMDIHFFFDLNRYAEQKQSQTDAFIDQIPGF